MKFLCDVHISYRLVAFLKAQGYEAIHVNHILHGSSTSDKDITAYADSYGFVVITKDSDFRNSHFINRTPKKVIRICLGNTSNKRLLELFGKHLTQITETLQQPTAYIELYDPMITIFHM